MNTPTPNAPIEFPPPVVNDVRPTAGSPPDASVDDVDGTRFNPTTGECRVVRLVRGVVYDSDASELVASVTGTDAALGLSLRRLYRTRNGAWFVIHLQHWHRLFTATTELMWALPDFGVLPIARSLVPDKDCRDFLLDWYGGGFLPRFDEAAKEWAREALSGEDLEMVLAAIASLPPALPADPA